MTRDVYAKKFVKRIRLNVPRHIQLDSAIRKSRLHSRGRAHDESRVSSIRTSQKKKIFVTNRDSANSVKTIKKRKIIAVLTLGSENRLDTTVSRCLSANKICKIRDLSTSDNVIALRKLLPDTRRFIHHWLSLGNVLIHCKRGVCRSPVVALDYLINVAKVEVEAAASLLVAERNCVRPTAILLQSIFE